MLKKSILLVLAFFLSFSAFADEISVKNAVEKKLGRKASSVVKSPYLNLYEVYVEGQIIYTDEAVSLLIDGHLIDAKTMKNVTEERIGKLSAIKFADLPLAQAIKIVKGNGKRVLVTFEDPNCGFCKRLAKSMVQTTDLTHYVFLLPILSPDSLEKSKQIWCSTDKAKAWTDWIIDGKAPSAKASCDTRAIQKNLEIGKQLNVTGTPTIFFTNGERIPGAAPIEEIEKRLLEIAAK